MPNVVHPDESFQYLEQAYRAANGRGIIPWEYAVGARSWIIPGLFVPFFAMGRILSLSPGMMFGTITVAVTCLSATAIAAAFVLGRRAAGRTGGLFAAAIFASWSEIVYFSPHVLADTLSVVPLMAALAIGYRRDPSRRALVCTGALLALTFAFRPQLAFALAIAFLWMGGRPGRARHLPMVLGGVVVLAIYGLIDWWTWGYPFSSLVVYYEANHGGVASAFGTSPASFYLRSELSIWWLATPVIIATSLLACRKLPLLGVMSAIIVLTFSMVAHKEYRFVYPAIPLIFTLAGTGTAMAIDGLAIVAKRYGGREARMLLMGLAILFWAAATTVSVHRWFLHDRLLSEKNNLDAIDLVNSDPGICGVGVYPRWGWGYAPYFRFRSDIGLYAGGYAQPSAAYNAVLLSPVATDRGRVSQSAFHVVRCFRGIDDLCVLRRPGGCTPHSGVPLRIVDSPVDKVIAKIGLVRR